MDPGVSRLRFNPTLVRLALDRWREEQIARAASFNPTLVRLARHWARAGSDRGARFQSHPGSISTER